MTVFDTWIAIFDPGDISGTVDASTKWGKFGRKPARNRYQRPRKASEPNLDAWNRFLTRFWTPKHEGLRLEHSNRFLMQSLSKKVHFCEDKKCAFFHFLLAQQYGHYVAVRNFYEWNRGLNFFGAREHLSEIIFNLYCMPIGRVLFFLVMHKLFFPKMPKFTT